MKFVLRAGFTSVVSFFVYYFGVESKRSDLQVDVVRVLSFESSWIIGSNRWGLQVILWMESIVCFNSGVRIVFNSMSKQLVYSY
jgi:hypothetical protein